MREKDLQSIIEVYPHLLSHIIQLGSNIKHEHVQSTKKRLDSVFENHNTRYVVEYQITNFDEHHIVRGLGYFINEVKNHPKFKHHLVFIAKRVKPRSMLAELLLYHSQNIPLTFIEFIPPFTFKKIDLEYLNYLEENDFSYTVRGKLHKPLPPQHPFIYKVNSTPRPTLVNLPMVSIIHLYPEYLKLEFFRRKPIQLTRESITHDPTDYEVLVNTGYLNSKDMIVSDEELEKFIDAANRLSIPIS